MVSGKVQTDPPPLRVMAEDPDFVDRVFAYLVELLPELSKREADLKSAMRQEFGGEDHYVRRKGGKRQERAQEVLRLFNGRNATEIARRLGCGRATVYRYLKQAGREK
ncbi:MAG: helix-turn-helix domain-containing protein [Rubrivivax sp.]|jgi:DNA invertase Pin-like site-specific DNA recombinase|nr:helix-turn-helix domain-containing protein [Rubrivivax sp.]